jgi:hypothetical protein
VHDLRRKRSDYATEEDQKKTEAQAFAVIAGINDAESIKLEDIKRSEKALWAAIKRYRAASKAKRNVEVLPVWDAKAAGRPRELRLRALADLPPGTELLRTLGPGDWLMQASAAMPQS